MRLVICDSDKKYLDNIQSYLIKKNPMGFEILTFNDIKSAVWESRKGGFEIFLVGESTYDESVKEVHATKIFILRESGTKFDTGYEFVSKYQSVVSLIGQILEMYASDDGCESQTTRGKTKTKLITFYSPEHHSAQSLSALAAAQVLGDKGNRVLYLNFHSFGGFEEMSGITGESDITDFMYFVLKRSEKLLYKLESIKKNMRGVDYLPPAMDYLALSAIKSDEWKEAIDMLMYSCEYTHIVVDISETCQGFYEILNRSEKTYILYNHNSRYAQACLNHFNRILIAKEQDKVLTRMKTYSLPYEIVSRDLSIQNLVSTEIGTYMRSVVE